jgi:hypothetical protein
MAVPKIRGKEAYVYSEDGIFAVIAYPSQKPICRSKHLRRATRRAQNLGFNVVMRGTQVLRGAVKVSWDLYVLLARRR